MLRDLALTHLVQVRTLSPALASSAPLTQCCTQLAAMFRSTLPLLALVALVSAQQLPAGAPACAATCLQAKLREAGTLVPGVDTTNVAALCSSSTFTGAFDQCLQDNCVRLPLSHLR